MCSRSAAAPTTTWPRPRSVRRSPWAPAWPSTPEEESLFRYGRVAQYLTGEDDFMGSLGRYEASTRRAFFQAAHRALYDAKAQGKNCVIAAPSANDDDEP